MDSDLNLPGLITSIVGIVAVSSTILQLKEHPKIRALLFVIIIGAVCALAWYASPMVTSGVLTEARLRAERNKQLDYRVTKEAQEVVDAQHEIELTRQRAELYEAQQREAESQRERDVAKQKEEQEKQHLEALQLAEKNLDAKNAILGTWRCGLLNATWEFRADGTLASSGLVGFFSPSITYEVIDSSHVRIRQLGIITSIQPLNLNGPQQTYGSGISACKRPKQ